MISLFAPNYSREAMEAVSGLMATGDIYSSRYVAELEEAFAAYVGAKYAIAVNSCTSALLLSLMGALPREARIPSITFCSVANSVIHSGNELRIVDETPVGRAYEIEDTGIWDSAHEVKHRKDWDEIDSVCYSFYPTKPLGGIGGGMIATNDDGLVDYIQRARMHGTDRKSYECRFEVAFPGWKMQMTELEAVVALDQLKSLPERDAIMEGIRLEYGANGIFSPINSQHIFGILSNEREKLEKALDEAEIQHSVHFHPLHLQPAYKQYASGEYPKSELWGKQELSLPFHEGLTSRQIEHISNTLKEADYGKV